MKIKSIICLLLSLGLGASSAFAQGDDSRLIRALIDFTAEFGGDPVATVYFTNGEDQSVKAGQGLSLGLGGELTIPAVKKLKVRGWVSYKYQTTMADNADITLTSVPINLTANWMMTNGIRFGAGLALHNAVKFGAGGLGDDIKFNNASGPLFEVGWKWIGLRYTLMEYVDGADIYDANAIGVSLSFAFPQ